MKQGMKKVLAYVFFHTRYFCFLNPGIDPSPQGRFGWFGWRDFKHRRQPGAAPQISTMPLTVKRGRQNQIVLTR